MGVMKRSSAATVIALLAGATIAGCSGAGSRETATLTICVAASLQTAMLELAPLFEQSHPGTKLTFNFGGSGTLEQQIERGAPADVFLSAAPKPMDALAAKGLILPGTRRDLLHNQIVLIVPKDSTELNSFQGLTDAKVKLIALGDPGSVPAGDYGRQVLEALRCWESVQPKLVLAKDVRQVVTYVETGSADAGIVYATDARESDKVRVAAIAPEDSHRPVVYPVAVLKDSGNGAAARAFVSFLAGTQARDIFARHGFPTDSP
jgi:molybdate transport system substrate-binding protein